ncbi:hypothetical protein A2U01_0063740, partial [Trifolium medium]|nr:hypothetical protein [Trifolium medium]
ASGTIFTVEILFSAGQMSYTMSDNWIAGST